MKQSIQSPRRTAAYFGLLFCPLLALEWYMNNDIWFLLASGRWVLANGIPYIEPLTLHEGLGFVMQQWLSSVIFQGLYAWGGEQALLLLVYAFSALELWLLWRLCMLVSEGNGLVSLLVTAAAGILLLRVGMCTRPQIFDAVLLTAELLCLERFRASKRPAWLLGPPLAAAALVNLHASMWGMVPLFLGTFLVEALFEKRWRAALWLGVSLLLTVAAAFLNPYGLEGMTYVLRSYGVDLINNQVNEMAVPDVKGVMGKLIYLTLALGAGGYLLKKRRKARLSHVLLALGCGYLTLSSIRSTMLFQVAGLYPLAYLTADWEAGARGEPFFTGLRTADRRPSRLLCAEGWVLLVVIVLGCVCGVMDIQHQNEDAIDALDWAATRYAPETYTIYTGYNDGSYAEFVGYRPYLDARAEVFLEANNGKAGILDEYSELQHGRLNPAVFLEKYRFQLLLVSENDILYYREDCLTDYALAYENGACRLYARLDA